MSLSQVLPLVAELGRTVAPERFWQTWHAVEYLLTGAGRSDEQVMNCWQAFDEAHEAKR